MYEKDRGQERPPALELTALTTICFFFVFTAWKKLCNKVLDYFMPLVIIGNKEEIRNFEAQSSSFGTQFRFYRTFNVRFKHCSLTNLIYSSSRLLFQKKKQPSDIPTVCYLSSSKQQKDKLPCEECCSIHQRQAFFSGVGWDENRGKIPKVDRKTTTIGLWCCALPIGRVSRILFAIYSMKLENRSLLIDVKPSK